MTTRGHVHPFRVHYRFQRRVGCVVLDWIGAAAWDRLVRRVPDGRTKPQSVGQM